MTEVRIVDGMLQVRLSRFDRFFGLLSDLVVDVGALTSVVVVDDALGSVPGWRAPGLAWPGRVKVGTWRSKGARWYVVARRGQPALVLTFATGRWAGAVLSTPDAALLGTRLGDGSANAGTTTPPRRGTPGPAEGLDRS